MLKFIVLALFANVKAHNWIFGDSRVPMASQLQPAPPRSGPRLPHRQVGPGQDFVVEWSTGHDGTYYFVVVKASDEGKLGENTMANLGNYLDEAPSDAYVYEDVRYERIHVSYPNMENDGSQYESRLGRNNPRWIDRSPFHHGTDFPQWKYSASDLAQDQRVAYFNPNYPWIEAVYKYSINSPAWANERDSARINIPARGGSGEYVVHMLWKGYRDVIDVDVLPEDAVDIYGTLSETKRWVKTDHCWYPNINGNDYSRCTYRQAGQESLDALRRCQQDFSRNRNQPRCNAVNCVPLFPPQQVKVNAWDSPMGAHVPWKDPSQENFNNGCNINNIPEDADENTYVCYGIMAQEPEDPAFNIETEDYWYVRDDDPEDPVYWSQCFRPEEERVFTGNVACPACESETAEVVQKWKVGHMCRTCEDVETFDDAPNGYRDEIPRWTIHQWALTETCERCF